MERVYHRVHKWIIKLGGWHSNVIDFGKMWSDVCLYLWIKNNDFSNEYAVLQTAFWRRYWMKCIMYGIFNMACDNSISVVWRNSRHIKWNFVSLQCLIRIFHLSNNLFVVVVTSDFLLTWSWRFLTLYISKKTWNPQHVYMLLSSIFLDTTGSGIREC